MIGYRCGWVGNLNQTCRVYGVQSKNGGEEEEAGADVKPETRK